MSWNTGIMFLQWTYLLKKYYSGLLIQVISEIFVSLKNLWYLSTTLYLDQQHFTHKFLCNLLFLMSYKWTVPRKKWLGSVDFYFHLYYCRRWLSTVDHFQNYVSFNLFWCLSQISSSDGFWFILLRKNGKRSKARQKAPRTKATRTKAPRQ